MLNNTLRAAAEQFRAPVLNLRRSIKRWAADTAGVVALVVVFCLPAFFAAAGVAVDLAQGYNLKTRLSGALDKAALAGGSTDGTPAEIEARIRAYFDANYPEGALGEAYDITVLTPPGMVDVHAKSKTKTVFMGIFGQDHIDVFAETIVRREISGLELVMVMDNTGSMLEDAGGGMNKLQASKTAANTLLGILYGDNSDVETLFVGVVPFSQAVNVGPSRTNWINSDSYNYGTTSWAGCVQARETSNRDVTDDPPYAINPDEPTTAKFTRYFSPCATSGGNAWFNTVGTEIATNSDFASSSGWTLGNDWSIGSGVLSKTLPANIITNGDFTSSSGWTLGTGWTVASGLATRVATNVAQNGTYASTANWTLGSGWSIASGVLTKSSTANSSVTEAPTVTLANSLPYSVVFTITARTAGSVRAVVGSTNGTSRNAVGTYTQTINANTSTSTIGLNTPDGFKGTIDNYAAYPLTTLISRAPTTALINGDMYEVSYSVSGQSAGSVRVALGATLGTARSTNGTFTEILTANTSTTTVSFTTGDGFVGSVDNLSVRHITTSSATSRSPSTALTQNAEYEVTFTVLSVTSGGVRASIGNTNGTTRSAAGTYTEIITAGSGSTIGLSTNNGFVGTVDNFSVKRLTSCGAGPTFTYESPLNSDFGPNKYCVVPMLPMTNVQADITAKINSMDARGATMINLGLAWGWRMLSPRWTGMWGGVMDSTDPQLPLAYDHPGMNKVIILMTDGDNTFGSNNYTAYGKLSDGRISTNQTTAEDTLDTRTANLCTTIKNKNILLYTIALGTGISTASKTMLKNCATSPAYSFVSPTGPELNTVFTTIANQLNSLHIVY
ncbi:MAG: pilus assembly protein TadG-related protein [bacterium]|nr:pilus assembly protein TadG-related protein [bacterium]